MALLDVRDLRVTVRTPHGDVQVVHGVDLTVEAGRIVGVVGDSGSGKSLTVQSIPQLVPEALLSGSVRFDGQELLGMRPRDLRAFRGRRIGVVFQDPLGALHPQKRIGNQVAEAVRAARRVSRRAATARAAELLQRVGIDDARNRMSAYPHELSGGMRQRVVLAIAISGEPELLIADEPTTALDVTVQARILELLAELCTDTGMAMLLVSHDIAVVSSLADDLVVLDAGRVADSGPIMSVLAGPHAPATARLLAAAELSGLL